MNFLTYLPHFREYFTDLPRTSSTTPTKSASTFKSTSASLSSSLPSILLTLLLAIPILLPTTFIATIAYIEYHRLPCTISWVKRLRTSLALAAGCCCRVCLRMVDGTKTTEREEEGDMSGNGIEDGEESGEGEKEEQEQEGNGTTARKGWYRDLGQRERYGKLFKNSSGGSEGDEMLLRDMEGSEDGLAVLL